MNELSLLNSFFDDAFAPTMSDLAFTHPYNMPKVDVKENKEGYFMSMDLPGMDEKDINLEIDHGTLTISSRHEDKKEEKKENDGKYLLRERREFRFTRRFSLPEDINAECVSATFKNGVLNVNIPRKELPAPKKIQIAVA